jgi:hypothetical protein
MARQRLAAVGAAVAIFLVSAIAQAQDANEGGENLLVLSTDLCGAKYTDRLSLSNCLERQNAKADRWMGAVVESYARMLAKDMAEVTEAGGSPFDTVAQLRKSHAAFDVYCKEAAELAFRPVIGMGGVFEGSMTYFDLTVDRARFLLSRCYRPLGSKLTDKVDLTIADCAGQDSHDSGDREIRPDHAPVVMTMRKRASPLIIFS